MYSDHRIGVQLLVIVIKDDVIIIKRCPAILNFCAWSAVSKDVSFLQRTPRGKQTKVKTINFLTWHRPAQWAEVRITTEACRRSNPHGVIPGDELEDMDISLASYAESIGGIRAARSGLVSDWSRGKWRTNQRALAAIQFLRLAYGELFSLYPMLFRLHALAPAQANDIFLLF